MTPNELEAKTASGKPVAVIVTGVKYGDAETGMFVRTFLYWKKRIKDRKVEGLWETYKPLSPLDEHDKMLLTNIYTKLMDYISKNNKDIAIKLLYGDEVESLYGKEIKMRSKNGK